ncbi:MAG TPA: undecaprenyldiphospho-muramoylpentapeptide beta-N-acetylglucosaminyltransferase [Dissulfurispiraceae bacterium]|nr:undecaprenyldiphospho-muramoylpentapeptide beta-N-acetylglucosaminyltransferase [Dissulfurispiraceae bacterium]
MTRILIAGGGTGGHVFPGLAIAEALLQHGVADEVAFVGTEHGIEARIIPQAGYKIHFLKGRGFVGKSAFQKLKAGALFAYSLIQARALVKRLRPRLVIGVGGYASVSLVAAAHFNGIPTMVHEQNAVPGLANRILGKLVDVVAATYQESLAAFPQGKIVLSGNPVRKAMLHCDERSARSAFQLSPDRFTIFVFGGSAGAHRINLAVAEALPLLADLRDSIQFIHQTGEADHRVVDSAYRSAAMPAVVVPFVYRMAEAYALADLVLCRAGATTLAEITAIGKPVILVPYPHAAGNHQVLNARKLEDMGAARVILDHELSGERVAESFRTLYLDETLRSNMRKAATAFARVDAADRIVQLAQSLMRKG